MFALTAEYDVRLAAPVLVKRAEDDPLLFRATVGEFSTSIQLYTYGDKRQKHGRERNWRVPHQMFRIRVTKDAAPPPEIQGSGDRTHAFEARVTYFDAKTTEYAPVAKTVVRRALNFFKYRLWQPDLAVVEEPHDVFQNPKWFDAQEVELKPHRSVLVARPTPGIGEEYGAILFERGHDQRFRTALSRGVEPTLRDELRYDAQSAIWSGNVRRAVLELALCAEVSVKETLFGDGARAAAVFLALEEQSRIRVSVPELIHNLAKLAVGTSFRERHPTEFEAVKHLFRARNSAAHRGRVQYRDDQGLQHTVERETLSEFWAAAETLSSWLKEVAKLP